MRAVRPAHSGCIRVRSLGPREIAIKLVWRLGERAYAKQRLDKSNTIGDGKKGTNRLPLLGFDNRVALRLEKPPQVVIGCLDGLHHRAPIAGIEHCPVGAVIETGKDVPEAGLEQPLVSCVFRIEKDCESLQ